MSSKAVLFSPSVWHIRLSLNQFVCLFEDTLLVFQFCMNKKNLPQFANLAVIPKKETAQAANVNER